MSEITDRVWSITLDGEPFIEETTGNQFKCTFEILQDFGGNNGYADIALYNLTANTANNILKKGVIVTFRAGYVGTIGVIFTGAIRNVLRERQGPTTITRVICNSVRVISEQPTINETLGVNSTVVQILQACATAMNYPLTITASDFENETPYINGYPMSGDPRVYLDKLALAHGFNYIVENETLIIVKENAYRAGEIFEVSQFTGMEGIPEITEEGVDVTVRLNPRLKIGAAYKISSNLATFNFSNTYFVDIPDSAGVGTYKVFRLAYTGDTKGDAWSTKITGHRILTS